MLQKGKYSFIKLTMLAALMVTVFDSNALAATTATTDVVSNPIPPQPTGVAVTELKPDAPQRHVVVKGDTLWDIAGKYYLNKPWLWPKLWQANRNIIANPHWIYPGQVLYLHVIDGQAFLDNQDRTTAAAGVVKLSPAVRDISDQVPIPTIDVRKLGHFFKESIALTADELAGAARVVAGEKNGTLFVSQDKIYAAAPKQQPFVYSDSNNYVIFRQPVAIRDLEHKKAVLGYSGQIIATAELLQEERQTDDGHKVTATLQIKSLTEEVAKNDLILPAPDATLFDFPIKVAAQPISGQIVWLYASPALLINSYDTVVLNKGANQAVELGQVFEVVKAGVKVKAQKKLILPDEKVGLALVFKVLDDMSYALIMDAEREIKLGDQFRTPE